MLHRDRVCPICHGNSHIRVKIVGSSTKALPVPVARCDKCDYTTYFEGVGLLSYFGNAGLAFPVLMFYFNYLDGAIPPLAIMGFSAVWIFAAPYLWLGLFVKTDIFSGFIDRRILASAREREEAERFQELINRDRKMRKPVLNRYITALSALTALCIMLTLVLIFRIAMTPSSYIHIHICLLMVLGVAYLMLGMEWKEKLDERRSNAAFLVRNLYFIPHCILALEIMVAAFVVFLFLL